MIKLFMITAFISFLFVKACNKALSGEGVEENLDSDFFEETRVVSTIVFLLSIIGIIIYLPI